MTLLVAVLLSAAAFFILLTVLVLIHEWGHFIAARRAGVVVEEFGFGLPPRFKTLFRHRGTRFSLNWIPFGGFVRLKGENALGDLERFSKGSFGAASLAARIVILVGGVTMNFLLAIVLLTAGFSFGRWIPTYLSFEEMQQAAATGVIHLKLGVLIEEIIPDSGAEKSGVPPKSVLLKVDGTEVETAEEVRNIQEGKKAVAYTFLPNGAVDPSSMEKTVTIPLNEQGLAGVHIVTFARELSAPRRGPPEAMTLALRESWVVTKQTILGIGQLFSSLAHTGMVPEGITGIIGIAQLTYASVQQGFMTYVRLVALISLSLAVLNILPFPALDGGRLLFVLVEVISRQPLNRRFELMTNAIGFGFLILLILLITFYDIARLF